MNVTNLPSDVSQIIADYTSVPHVVHPKTYGYCYPCETDIEPNGHIMVRHCELRSNPYVIKAIELLGDAGIGYAANGRLCHLAVRWIPEELHQIWRPKQNADKGVDGIGFIERHRNSDSSSFFRYYVDVN
jgi:hypothetical protein